MLQDYFSEVNDHGTVVPVKDLAAFPRSEQAVLGAKNMCCITGKGTTSSNTDVTYTENSVRIKSDTAAAYINSELYIKPLPKNKDVKISFDATITSGSGIMIVKGKATGGSYAVILNQPFDNSGSYEVSFNTGANDDFELNVYASKGTATTGDITYNNIMISFDGGEYVPFVMTNEQLTEKVTPIPITFTPETGITVARNTSVKLGNIAVINMAVTLSSAFSAQVIGVFDLTLKELQYLPSPSIYGATPANVAMRITTSGSLQTFTNTSNGLQAGEYWINGVINL